MILALNPDGKNDKSLAILVNFCTKLVLNIYYKQLNNLFADSLKIPLQLMP